MNHPNLNQLIILCQSMHSEGKTPSVAMIRAKAPFKASVTEAIEAIKRFNVSAHAEPSPAPKKQAAEEASLTQRVVALENEVSELKAQIARLLNQ